MLKKIPNILLIELVKTMMEMGHGDDVKTPIWDDYKKIIEDSEEAMGLNNDFMHMERFAFYERAKKSYVIVVTSEPALYANIILKKGVVIN